MRSSTLRKLAPAITGLIFSSFAACNVFAAGYSYPTGWSGFYKHCLRKFELSEIMVFAHKMDRSAFSAEENAAFEELLKYPDKACSCMSTKASEAFQQAGYKLSPFELEILGRSIRFEEPYPEEGIAETFGAAVLPCLDIEPLPAP